MVGYLILGLLLALWGAQGDQARIVDTGPFAGAYACERERAWTMTVTVPRTYDDFAHCWRVWDGEGSLDGVSPLPFDLFDWDQAHTPFHRGLLWKQNAAGRWDRWRGPNHDSFMANPTRALFPPGG